MDRHRLQHCVSICVRHTAARTQSCMQPATNRIATSPTARATCTQSTVTQAAGTTATTTPTTTTAYCV